MNYNECLIRTIDRWFEEDIGDGDHTTLSTIPASANGYALLYAKQPGIIAGITVAGIIFMKFDPDLKLDTLKQDGDPIMPGDTIFRISGSVRSILQCERLVLNVMQRMSGIATSTREYVMQLEGTGTRILDTRKTTPGFRMLEKEAFRIGGGVNHRFGLNDMILIKDNHIDFAGGIGKAIERAAYYQAEKGLDLQVVVEARSLADVEEVLASTGGRVNRILLDNFSPEDTRHAVEMIGDRYETESSGGITLETIRSYAECGVDFISVGAVTHQIKSLDLSLKAEF
jgi:nicotinate-nucleotide pyrophosphorylase (carboxylating)